MASTAFLLALLILAGSAAAADVASCRPGEQRWVLRVAGPPQLSHTCLVELQLRREGCKVDLRYSTPDVGASRADRCSWLQLTGSVSEAGDLVVLRGPAAPHHGVGKWTLSSVSSSNLHLTSPDGRSVLYKIVEEPATTAQAAMRKLRGAH